LALSLTTLQGRFAVCRLPADAEVPPWVTGAVTSVTRTPDELSITCAEDAVPEGITAERGWRCLKVEGPLDLALTGIAAALTTPLAEAKVSVSVIATYDTDYLLVKEERLADALAALERAGHTLS
jgi:hypothetical protein